MRKELLQKNPPFFLVTFHSLPGNFLVHIVFYVPRQRCTPDFGDQNEIVKTEPGLIDIPDLRYSYFNYGSVNGFRMTNHHHRFCISFSFSSSSSLPSLSSPQFPPMLHVHNTASLRSPPAYIFLNWQREYPSTTKVDRNGGAYSPFTAICYGFWDSSLAGASSTYVYLLDVEALKRTSSLTVTT